MADEAKTPAAAPGQEAPRREAPVDLSNVTTTYANWYRVTGSPEELLLEFGLTPNMGLATDEPIRVAQAYLEYLYSPEGQEIAAKRYYRPRSEAVTRKYGNQFPKVKLFTLAEIIGDWQKTNKIHFADGGLFDQIYQPQ